MDADDDSNEAVISETVDLSAVMIRLLKGVVYREDAQMVWSSLLDLQVRVRDYVRVLGLDLVLDDSEGYAFLKSRPTDDTAKPQPRLIARRPLSYPVSLILALLRKKLAEFDAKAGETRLVLTRDDIVETVRVFFPAAANEVRLFDQIDAHLNKIIELGFVRKLKSFQPGAVSETFEVRRILKAFVDAQWLAEFDDRLEQYRLQSTSNDGSEVGRND